MFLYFFSLPLSHSFCLFFAIETSWGKIQERRPPRTRTRTVKRAAIKASRAVCPSFYGLQDPAKKNFFNLKFLETFVVGGRGEVGSSKTHPMRLGSVLERVYLVDHNGRRRLRRALLFLSQRLSAFVVRRRRRRRRRLCRRRLFRLLILSFIGGSGGSLVGDELKELVDIARKLFARVQIAKELRAQQPDILGRETSICYVFFLPSGC
jgi:hypothetical protein